MIYSYDVYDTLVTRIALEPKCIFHYMSQRMKHDDRFILLPSHFIYDFPRIRENAENYARMKKGGEVLIDDIYEEIRDDYQVDSNIIKCLMNLELEFEIRFSIPIEENIIALKKLILDGERVVLITDMYMNRSFFSELFNKVCPELNNLPIYISGEEKVSKASGKLYELVKNKEGLTYGDWKHIGDNVISDYSIPSLLGINADLYSRNHDDDNTRRILSVLDKSDYILFSFINGLQRRSDYIDGCNGFKIGYTFVGIILYAYVNWIIEQAVLRKIKSLYFIARDGYILKQIADIIVKERTLDINVKYLYGSRKAWRIEDELKKDLLKRYLQQEIKEKENEYALVDTQGTGLSIDYISRLLGQRINVFYYTLIESAKDKQINPIVYSSYSGGDMIEVFCRAPHGSTEGYEEQKKLIVPVLSNVPTNIFKQNEFDDYVNGILDFTKDYTSFELALNNEIPLSYIADSAVRYSVYRPDKMLADFVGEIPHDSCNKSETNVYAPYLTEKEIKKIEYDRRTEYIEEVYEGVNLLYSYKRLNEKEKKLVFDYRKKYYSQKIEKDDDAMHVVLYGYGVYGQELYHRLFGSSNVIVEGVVDANFKKYNNEIINIEPLSRLKKKDYDYIVISLYNERLSNEIKELLVAAGIERDRIIQREEFLNKYIQ